MRFWSWASSAVAAAAGFVLVDPLEEVRRAGFDVLADGFGGVELELLREIADAEAAPGREIAGIGGELAGQDLQEAGFAAAVPAHEAHLLAFAQGQGDGFEEALVAIGQRQVVGGKECGCRNSHAGRVRERARKSEARIPENRKQTERNR